jgi:hypothetical protein
VQRNVLVFPKQNTSLEISLSPHPPSDNFKSIHLPKAIALDAFMVHGSLGVKSAERNR